MIITVRVKDEGLKRKLIRLAKATEPRVSTNAYIEQVLEKHVHELTKKQSNGAK